MRALVTGGGGFLGGAIVTELLARGAEVVSFARGEYRSLAARGVRTLRGDLQDRSAVERACTGIDTVFHVAAKAGIWGAEYLYTGVNVTGTKNVIDACVKHGVKRLVYTSSPSVCFDGRDHVGASNDLPYATKFIAAYPASKAEAEKLVIAANQPALATCALRPHLIFGPGDPHLLPRLVTRARAGSLAIVGSGENEVTLTYIDNAAHAHVAAAERLAHGAPHAGRAYFIAQTEPVKLWPWIQELLASLDLAPITRRVPLSVAWLAGATLESLGRLRSSDDEPRMTRFLALELARSHCYDMLPAARDFGYAERVSMAVATERTISDLRARGAG